MYIRGDLTELAGAVPIDLTGLVSFLYLDLYVLGDDAMINWGSFMQTNLLYVLIHI